MEDSFSVRVDKAFGSLSSSTAAPSSNLSSLWRLTDEEIERNEWKRDKDSPEPESETLTDSFPFKRGFLSSNRENSGVDFRWELEKDLDDLDDDNEQSYASSSQSVKPKPDDYNEEEWEIKNSIGLDCTLDYEEEEDEFDKVAVGKEKPDDRVYMKGITDYGIDIDSNNELPDTFKDIPRDPRANHIAAKLRLKEDAEAAKKMDSLRVSEQDSPPGIDDHIKVSSFDDGNLKSILKRKDNESVSKSINNELDSKSQKRVRFDPECKDGDDKDSDEVKNICMETDSVDECLVYHLPPDYPSGIPDYMRNPSKYTRYTFDSSSDVDEQSNRQAFWDFLKMLKKSNSVESQPDDVSDDRPKSLTFIPKRKSSEAEMVTDPMESKQNQDDINKEPLLRKSLPISIAAGTTEDSEPSVMEEEESETAASRKIGSQRLGRKYRTKNSLEIMDESV
ncbi:hypothetical protein JCGZ_26875 [Jatropha curcas]|uniref:U5 small nuclear ribonucleoprotein TSSC4 n=1 Tax=Jatropha curcas TaxID=180498 RepID=A0A067L0B3_JATCU|nr:uncharacterized protein LOC105630212 [Jatropha curcas]KDP41857.1 hypothetical protein JCGZ_26875 [Jatropha curcas]